MNNITFTRIYSDRFFYRFDLMCGVNGQEGVTQMYFSVGGFAAMKNETIENGVSLDLAKEFLHFMCSTQYSKQAPQLCVEHIVYTYRLDKAKNDIQRARRLSFFLGKLAQFTEQDNLKRIPQCINVEFKRPTQSLIAWYSD